MILLLEVQRIVEDSKQPSDEKISQWISQALNHLQEKAEICVRLVDENESAALNETYRKKKGCTNILSFPYDDLEDSGYRIGDLVICSPLVEKEALKQNKSLESHWAHLCVHGTLHLLGYDHINDKEAEVMEALEIEILKSLGFSNPYFTE